MARQRPALNDLVEVEIETFDEACWVVWVPARVVTVWPYDNEEFEVQFDDGTREYVGCEACNPWRRVSREKQLRYLLACPSLRAPRPAKVDPALELDDEIPF